MKKKMYEMVEINRDTLQFLFQVDGPLKTDKTSQYDDKLWTNVGFYFK